ncbi:hypothetical protein LOD99_4439 [Oopsacas minuta]|uniref:SUZ domain-containing protein n=1 Tax=Oopsacas minuta TaxID=111878 RepID=A0AAV7JW57_9METZ|nr:hypothetical protein LOD99_4439 [Oopsacas minuta]
MEDKDILDNWEDADDDDFEKKMTEREEKYKEKERKRQKRSKIKSHSSSHSTQQAGEASKSPTEDNSPKFKILKRNHSDDNRIDNRTENKLDALNKQTFQERLQNKEATYAEARARVFGQDPTSSHSQQARYTHDTHRVKIKR